MPDKKSANRGEDRTQQMTRWVTLGRACEVVGVNESTLRRWADAGQVRSFRTPGGHRRFAEEDLRAMTAGRSFEPTTSVYESLGELAVTRIRRRLQRNKGQGSQWSDDEEQDRLRPLGQRIATLVSDYLSKRGRRQRLLEEARELGVDYGRDLAAEGLVLEDALESFTSMRKGFDDAVVELVRRNSFETEELAEVWEGLSNLSDQILLGLGDAYESERVSAVAGATS